MIFVSVSIFWILYRIQGQAKIFFNRICDRFACGNIGNLLRHKRRCMSEKAKNEQQYDHKKRFFHKFSPWILIPLYI